MDSEVPVKKKSKKSKSEGKENKSEVIEDVPLDTEVIENGHSDPIGDNGDDDVDFLKPIPEPKVHFTAEAIAAQVAALVFQNSDMISSPPASTFSLAELAVMGTNTRPGLQKLEEKATKAQEAFEKEEKLRKEMEAQNAKLLAEKNALLDSLSGEKGALQDFQEKAAKLNAQKADLENQLRVSIYK